MNSIIPAFRAADVWLAPWTQSGESTGWIALMGFFVAASCGMVGVYLILRRMALVGDAISHSVLPGLVIAFLLSQSRGSFAMFAGALVAGVVTTLIIEVIHKRSRVKQDAAIGIAFTTLFAFGVILVSLFTARVDLDQECVLYGEIAFVPLEEMVRWRGLNLGPSPVFRMGVVTILTALGIRLFYKQLLVSSFDPGLAVSLGISAVTVHYGLMAWLSVVVVSAFESVGAVLVVAMLILPGATASLLVTRLPHVFVWVLVLAAASSVLGIHLATWLNCSMAAAMVVMATALFVGAWAFSVARASWQRRRWQAETPPHPLGESRAGTN